MKHSKAEIHRKKKVYSGPVIMTLDWMPGTLILFLFVRGFCVILTKDLNFCLPLFYISKEEAVLSPGCYNNKVIKVGGDIQNKYYLLQLLVGAQMNETWAQH